MRLWVEAELYIKTRLGDEMLKLRSFFVVAMLGLILCSCKHPCQIDALGETCWITRCKEQGEDVFCRKEKWQELKQCEKEAEIELKPTQPGSALIRFDVCRREKWAKLERIEHERVERERVERERGERKLELKRCEKEMAVYGEACFKARAERDIWERQRNDWELEQEEERAERERAERKLRECEQEMGVKGEDCFEARELKLERERAERAERERAERERAERERDKHLIKKCDCWYRCQSNDNSSNSYLVITSMCAARCGTHSTRVAQTLCGEYARRGWVKTY